MKKSPIAAAAAALSFAALAGSPDQMRGADAQDASIADRAATSTSVYFEPFNGSKLKQGWTFIVPDGAPPGQSYSLKANRGYLRMTTTGPTDLANALDTAPKVMRIAPGGDYQIEVHMIAAPDQYYEHAGILVYARPLDEDPSFVRVIRDMNLNSVMMQCQYQGNWYGWAWVPSNDSDLVLRLTKIGSTYEAAFATDGVSFTPLGSCENPFVPELVGVTAVSTPDGNEFSADFDYFRVTPLN